MRELEDLEATRRLGAELAAQAQPGTVIALVGPLGAGKTELVRGFMSALPGARMAEVARPTFALVHRYESTPPVWHLDWYRLENEAELAAIGAEEFLDPLAEVTLVEWADRFPEWLPPTAWRVRLECTSESTRRAHVHQPQKRAKDLENRGVYD